MTHHGRAVLGHRPCRIAAAALATVTLMLVGAREGPSSGGQPENSIGIRLVDVPSDRVDDPRASTAIVDHVAPGGRFERRIDIISTVPEAVDVEVYSGNGEIRGGIFSPDDDDRPGIADWITIDQPVVTLPPNGTQRVTVAVDVPNNAPTGEYYGFVWAEPPTSSGQVSIANRVGVRLYLSVGTGEEPPVDFSIGAMTAARTSDGVPVVTTRLRNTGGRALDITGELLLTDGPAGLDAGPFPFDGAISLNPDEIGTMTITLDPELPDGPWLARIEAVSGLLERTAEAQISFPADSGAEAPPAETETIGGTDAEGNDISDEIRNQRRMLLPLAAILILLAIAALYLMLVWKRREQEEDDEEEPVAVGATSAAGEDEGS